MLKNTQQKGAFTMQAIPMAFNITKHKKFISKQNVSRGYFTLFFSY